MASDNLGTASLYINNLLLSRGLLRNGAAIDFARPDLAEGGIESTMGRVMSLINDLILRRDRDASQREVLSENIRTLKADALQQNTKLTRQAEKHADAVRKLGLTEGVERSLTMRLKAAETSAKAVKDEMARLRLLLDQTRTSCALEVRKRETSIRELKKRIDESRRVRGSGKPVADDLKTETNDFLTKLASGLREENEKLSALVKATFQSLQQLSGYEGIKLKELNVSLHKVEFDLMSNEMENVIEHLRKLLTNPSFVPIEEVEVREVEIRRLREGWERMEDRWKDAIVMMDGWKKRMEHGGRTVNIDELTQGLNLSPIKDTDKTLPSARLMDRSLSMLEEEDECEEGDTQADIDAMDDSQVPITTDGQSEMEGGSFEEDREMCDNEAFSEDGDEIFEDESEQTSPSIRDSTQTDPQLETQDLTFTSITSGGSPPQLSPLRSININTQENLNHRNHDAFTTIVEENTWDLAQLEKPKSEDIENLPTGRQTFDTPEFDLFKSPVKSSNHSTCPSMKLSGQDVAKDAAQRRRHRNRADNTLAGVEDEYAIRKSSPAHKPNTTQPQQSPITMSTIASKLAATEREADAARVRAKLKASRAAKLSNANVGLVVTPELALQPSPRRATQLETSEDKVKGGGEENEPAARKRKGVKSKGGRRRSTLSPWEMEVLINGDVQV